MHAHTDQGREFFKKVSIQVVLIIVTCVKTNSAGFEYLLSVKC